MNIGYIEPLKRAWDRMKQALFKPFNIGKWFVVGFAAWLAGLLGNMQGFSYRGGDYDHYFKAERPEELFAMPAKAWQWLLEHSVWIFLGMIAFIVIIGIIVLLLWLSSRGKFMFLDNVVHNRAEIKRPWRQYARLGDSLFLWRMVFGLICGGIMIIIVGLFLLWGTRIFPAQHFMPAHALFILSIFLVIFLLVLCIVFITLMLENFIVPIMYRYNLRATEAWNKFLPLMFRNFGWFLLYCLFLLALAIIIGMSIVVAGFCTCCIGFILLIIPYIGTVILLPILYTYRALSLEFLAQFDHDLRL